MAGSYFELLTEQEGLPAKPFDPIEELKRLRRELMLRTQVSELSVEEIACSLPFRAKIIQPEVSTKDVTLPPPGKIVPSEMESVSLESVTKKADEITKTLAIWQHSRHRTRPIRDDIFRGRREFWSKKQKPATVARFLTTPQEETLKTLNAGLMALGIIGVVFGVLSFFQGLESDFSLGSLVCVTGAAVIVIGLGGRFLASRLDPAK